jgi:hypothetical protein
VIQSCCRSKPDTPSAELFLQQLFSDGDERSLAASARSHEWPCPYSAGGGGGGFGGLGGGGFGGLGDGMGCPFSIMAAPAAA